jgi:hypothetical protein
MEMAGSKLLVFSSLLFRSDEPSESLLLSELDEEELDDSFCELLTN